MDPFKNTSGLEIPTVREMRCPLPKVARRLGAAAFLFFLIKGLVLWVFIPLGALIWAMFR